MVIAGEVSGDMHAARLVAAIRQASPHASFFGIGGDELRACGVELFHDTDEMAVMGLAEVLSRYGFFRRVFKEMIALAEERQPDAVILVDYPGFNLRLAKQLHKRGIKVIYYICPQVWAWHRSRIPHMAAIVDHLITIFPFEADHFSGTGLPVTFAGHPLVETCRRAREAPLSDLQWSGAPKVALLPGSRNQEIRRMLPVMWAAAQHIETKHPGASFVIAAPSPRVETMVRNVLARHPAGPGSWTIVQGQTREVLRRADAAMVASGTATIEAALMRCPMVVTYKVAPLTYLLGKLLVHVNHIGMVNIVAGREICPELIQHCATPSALADAMDPYLTDGPARQTILAELDRVMDIMGAGNTDGRAAEVVLNVLSDSPSAHS